MKFHTNFVLGIIALELSACMCQFGGEMMGGMGGEMFGGMGGLALMSGMGALGGQGGMGSMALSRASNSVSRAVHFIVGPTASPDQEILNYAASQGREPTSMRDMMGYIPHMQRIARATYGQFLSSMASQNAATTPSPSSSTPSSPSSTPSSSSSTTTNQSPSAATKPAAVGSGKTLDQLLADLNATVMQRAVEWMQQMNSQRGSGTGMADMSLMLPFMF